jgi:hypothetical protein
MRGGTWKQAPRRRGGKLRRGQPQESHGSRTGGNTSARENGLSRGATLRSRGHAPSEAAPDAQPGSTGQPAGGFGQPPGKQAPTSEADEPSHQGRTRLTARKQRLRKECGSVRGERSEGGTSRVLLARNKASEARRGGNRQEGNQTLKAERRWVRQTQSAWTLRAESAVEGETLRGLAGPRGSRRRPGNALKRSSIPRELERGLSLTAGAETSERPQGPTQRA